MKMKVFYLLGYPGSGKTTLMRHVFAGSSRRVTEKPFAHTWHGLGDSYPIVELGRQRPGGFGGTDALAMNATTRVEAWLDAMRDDVYYVVGEGDRLATDRFFQFCQELGELTVALLGVSPEEAQRRCARRGSTQAASWWKGRVSKVDRLADHWVSPDWRLDGSRPASELAVQVQQHAVFQPLRSVV